VKGVGRVLGNFIREEDELAAREPEPYMGGIPAHVVPFRISARDLEERSVGSIVKGVGGRVLGNFIREEGELAAREPEPVMPHGFYPKILTARELEERGIGKDVFTIGKIVANKIREEDELAAREPEPVMPHGFGSGHGPITARDLEERGVGSVVKGVGKVLGNFIREEDELAAREPEPYMGGIPAHVVPFGRISARDLEERGVGNVVKGVGRVLGNFIREENELAAREPEPVMPHGFYPKILTAYVFVFNSSLVVI
jgi:hypothetical protein